MLGAPAPAANAIPFPVAAVPLTPLARQALLPSRLGPAWRTARWLDQAIDRLDLGCLAKLYRRRRGSWPFSPLLLLKIALFCIADGLPSPQDWAQMANRDGPCRWLAWGSEPSASTCYAFRDRLGVARLFELNRQVLALAQADGLSPANRGAIDGTLQEALASRHHLVNPRRLEQGLQALQEPLPPAPQANPAPATQAPDTAPVEPLPGGAAVSVPVGQGPAPKEPAAKQQRRPVRPGHTQAGRDRQRQRWQRAEQQLHRRQTRNQNKRASKRTDPDKMVISPTDPEAAIGRDKRGVFRPLYNAQLVADLDSNLILGYEALAQPNDNGLLPIMLKRTEQLLGHKLAVALVDAGYTGGQELAQAEQAGVEVLGPCAGQSSVVAPSPQQFPKRAFGYDGERDVYVCPQGQTLRCVGQSQQKRSSVELVVLKQYRCASGECQACPLKQECCPKSGQGRSISRSEHEGSIERLRERMNQPEKKKSYQRRAATVERLFGDGKERRGLERVSGRGLKQARIQLALMVLQHNLRVLGRALEAAKKEKGEPPRERRIA